MSESIQVGKFCHGCRFFSETEDGDCYCAVYGKTWEIDEDGSYTGIKFADGDKPGWCKATSVTINVSNVQGGGE